MEQKYPAFLNIIILGYFNRANLNHELPKYRQYIKCPTREKSSIDHCYNILKGCWLLCPPSPPDLGHSDHHLVVCRLLPPYKQKSAKPVAPTLKSWTMEAKLELQESFDRMDWSVFETVADDVDELIGFVTTNQVLQEHACSHEDSKKIWQWQTMVHFKTQLRQEKEVAYRSGDRICSNNNRVAKSKYAEKEVFS